MKKATVLTTGIFFFALTGIAFAGEFASDLKGAFKSTISTVYRETGKLYGVGPTLQGVQKFAYGNIIVNGYNAANSASMAFTRAGIDQQINNVYRTQTQLAWAPYNIANSASKAYTGAGIDQHMTGALRSTILPTYDLFNSASTTLTGAGIGVHAQSLLPAPIYLGAEKFRLYLVNSPYANLKQKTPAETWYSEFEYRAANGHSQKEADAQVKEQCLNGESYFKKYYKDSGAYGSMLQCFKYLEHKGTIKLVDYRFNPDFKNAGTQAMRASAATPAAHVNLSGTAGGR
jgi:hypothetical protein